MGLILRTHRTSFVMPGDVEAIDPVTQQPVTSGGGHPGVEISSRSFLVGTVSQQIMQRRVNREYLELQNQSGLSVWVNIDGDANQDTGFEVPSGGSWSPVSAPVGHIHVVGATANQRIVVMEGF